jgi:predicted RNA-binding protein with PIN domain
VLLIVDGYNIIGAWPEFAKTVDLAQSRDRLIHMLADYAGFSGAKIILVFDGYGSDKKSVTLEEQFGIQVVYTRQHETADHYIERTVDQFLEGMPKFARADVRVATNDALEQSVVLSRGAIRLPAAELRREVLSVRGAGRERHGGGGTRRPMTFEDRLTDAQKERLERMRRGE